MNRFYVGQRVRKVRGRHNVGFEGRVAGLRVSDRQTVCVVWDRDGLAMVGNIEAHIPAGTPAWCWAHQLEPIQPEGHQPSEFTTLADLLDSLEVTA